MSEDRTCSFCDEFAIESRDDKDGKTVNYCVECSLFLEELDEAPITFIDDHVIEGNGEIK